MISPSTNWVGNVGNISDDSTHSCIDLETTLKPEYRGHSVSFWRALQRLHDNSIFWTPTGLSYSGQYYTEKLLKMYADEN